MIGELGEPIMLKFLNMHLSFLTDQNIISYLTHRDATNGKCTNVCQRCDSDCHTCMAHCVSDPFSKVICPTGLLLVVKALQYDKHVINSNS